MICNRVRADNRSRIFLQQDSLHEIFNHPLGMGPWGFAHATDWVSHNTFLGTTLNFGWMGGGDVKLAGAVFLWAGPQAGLVVFSVVSVAGLPIALLMIALDRFASAAVQARHRWLDAFAIKRGVPYGVALACGGAWAVWMPIPAPFSM